MTRKKASQVNKKIKRQRVSMKQMKLNTITVDAVSDVYSTSSEEDSESSDESQNAQMLGS